MSANAGPLAGLRVLDFTRVLSGPWATQLLGDLGAEIIKIEKPGEGDDFRRSPPHLKDRNGQPTGESSLYLSTNRNKKSFCVDITKAGGKALVLRLAAVCDIAVENFRAGYMKRRGLDYDAMAEVNPGIIYCAISGYGQTGPYAQRAGYDSTFQAFSGMMSFTGHPDGQPGGGPMRTGPSLSDVNSGMYAAVAVLSALHHRGKSGRGQFIDLGMLDATLAMVSHHAMAYLVTGEDATRAGNSSPYGAPTGMFMCADGPAMINGAEDFNFVKLCAALGCPELSSDPRFTPRTNRVRNQWELHTLIEERTRVRKRSELLAALEAEGLPCAPVNDTPGAFADPQVQHRQMLRDIPHPLAGSIRMVANPLRFSETPLERYEAPPTLGQHNAEVLQDLLGLTPEEIDQLRRDGALS